MARALLVGCGCRGRMLGKVLLADGWAVRGTSRSPEGTEAIAAAGIEPALADPDRVGTIVELLGDVTVVAWLLASATGTPEEVAALHTDRLGSLLEKTVDTPVRGFAYESRGSAGEEVLSAGEALIADAAGRWHVPTARIDADPADAEAWVEAAAAEIRALIGL
jgi:uncharacterized protein YbjT (DUF2867 family)